MEHKKTGKALGARKFLSLLKKKNIKPMKIFCFGDNLSDYAMHTELIKKGIDSTFIFVNDPTNLKGKDLTKVEFTTKPFFSFHQITLFESR